MSNVVIRSKEDVAFIASGALLSLWVFWVNSNSHAAGSAGSYLHPYLFSSLFAFAIAALAPRLNLTTRTIRIGDASAAILGFAASLLVSMTASRATPQWLLAFMAIGLSSVWFQTRMHMRLLSQNLFDVLRFSLMSSIVYGLLGWSLSLLSDTGAVLVGLISPLACAACLHQLPLDPPKKPEKRYFSGSTRELVVGPFACICGLCFVYAAANILLKVDFGSFAFGPDPSTAISACTYLVILLVFVLAYWFYVIKKHALDFYTLMKVPVALLTCALVTAGILGSHPALQILVSPTIWIVSAAFRIFVVDAVQHGDGIPLRRIVLWHSGYSLTYYLGRCFFYGLSGGGFDTESSLNQEFCFLLLGIIVAIVIIAFRLQDHTADLLFRDINNVATIGAVSGSGDYELICTRYARKHNLSERETEILLYVARGYSKPFIAEKLSISDNTVRTHVKRIYEKCSVHSRRELQENIENEGSEATG